jgi:hypothetical protein
MKTIKQLFLGGIILLSAVKVKAQIPNPSFEQWQTRNFGVVKFEDPRNWMSNNFYFAFTNPDQLPIKKTTDAHTGTYAVEITNVPDTSESKQGGSLISGNVNFLTQEYNLKFKLSAKPKSLEAFYKYFPVNNDSFNIEIVVSKNGEYLGSGSFKGVEAKNDYTKLSAEIQYIDETTIPDSASIFIYAGNAMQVIEGTKLILDDLSFTDAPVSVSRVKNNDLAISVYPNPAQDKLFFNINNQNASVTLMDLNGKIITQNEITKTNNYIDLTGINNGIYLAQITTELGVVNHKIVVNQ